MNTLISPAYAQAPNDLPAVSPDEVDAESNLDALPGLGAGAAAGDDFLAGPFNPDDRVSAADAAHTGLAVEVHRPGDDVIAETAPMAAGAAASWPGADRRADLAIVAATGVFAASRRIGKALRKALTTPAQAVAARPCPLGVHCAARSGGCRICGR